MPVASTIVALMIGNDLLCSYYYLLFLLKLVLFDLSLLALFYPRSLRKLPLTLYPHVLTQTLRYLGSVQVLGQFPYTLVPTPLSQVI